METMNVAYFKNPTCETVFAIFPDDTRCTRNSHNPADRQCVCYAHVGQHSAATFGYVSECEFADKSEYADLHAELSRIYESGDDTVSLAVINESNFHFSRGATLHLRGGEDSCVGMTMAYPFPCDSLETDIDLLECLADLGGHGDQTNAVAELRRHRTFTASPEDTRDFLRGYGTWDDNELADHDENMDRLLWLAGCNLREHGEFYMED